MNKAGTGEQPVAAEEWAGEAGQRWLANLDGLERMIEPIGVALLARAAYRRGERVVDIGCGGGWTTRQIAKAVGDGGAVLGLDISPDLVRVATERAEAAGLRNIRFEVGDAASAIPADAPFERLFSRFGCMFFADPYGAFANLRRMIRDGGRLDIVVWASAQENRWVAALMEVLMKHIELPVPVPRAPGPFALAEVDYVRDLLTRGGFADPRIEPWNGLQYIGGPGCDPPSATEFVLKNLHIGNLVRDADPRTMAAVKADLTAMFAAHQSASGVALPARAWMVTAAASA